MTIAVPRGNHTPRARVQPVSNFCGIDSSESMAKTALGLRLFFTLLVMTRLDASLVSSFGLAFVMALKAS